MKVQSKIFNMSTVLTIAIIASTGGYSVNAEASFITRIFMSKTARKTEKLERQMAREEKTAAQLRESLAKDAEKTRKANLLLARYDQRRRDDEFDEPVVYYPSALDGN